MSALLIGSTLVLVNCYWGVCGWVLVIVHILWHRGSREAALMLLFYSACVWLCISDLKKILVVHIIMELLVSEIWVFCENHVGFVFLYMCHFNWCCNLTPHLYIDIILHRNSRFPAMVISLLNQLSTYCSVSYDDCCV